MSSSYGPPCLFFIFAAFFLAGKSDPELPENPVVENLILELGSKNFKKRTEAERRLHAMPDSIPYLKRVRSEDPEVNERIKNILSARTRKPLTQKMLDRARNYAKAGEVELAVEQLLAVEPPVLEEKYWQAALDVGSIVREKAMRYYQKDFAKPIMVPETTIANFFETRHQQSVEWVCVPGPFAATDASFDGCLRAGGARGGDFRGLLISSKKISFNQLADSVVLTQHGGELGSEISRTLLVSADGESIGRPIDVHDSIVICRQPISALTNVENSIIISSQDVSIDKRMGHQVNSIIRGKVARPVDFIKWFDTAQIGIEIVREKGNLEITLLDPNLRFANAGCKLEDRILSVDSKSIDSVEEFRCALRRGVIEGKVSLKVLRGTKMLEIPVELEP